MISACCVTASGEPLPPRPVCRVASIIGVEPLPFLRSASAPPCSRARTAWAQRVRTARCRAEVALDRPKGGREVPPEIRVLRRRPVPTLGGAGATPILQPGSKSKASNGAIILSVTTSVGGSTVYITAGRSIC